MPILPSEQAGIADAGILLIINYKTMKKRRDCRGILPPAQKFFKVTRIFLFLTLAFVFQARAAAWCQDQIVNLKMKDCNVEEFLREVKKQTGVRFIYKSEFVRDMPRFDVNADDSKLAELLEKVFDGTKVRCVFEDDVVILTQQQQQEESKFVRISGKVTDVNNNPMPGVTVRVKGANYGVATDEKGGYSIEVPRVDGLVLVYSFVGMETKEVRYSGKTMINVSLQESVAMMDEVVVDGYQTIKKRSMAGSISTVRAEDLVINRTQTLESVLQGQLPGVMVINQSGLTGTRQKVRVRGTATLMGNPEPVWVVDGIIQEDPLPFEASTLTNMGGGTSADAQNMDMIKDFVGSAISWLNPSDIENISVLKDASSTAIYGVKAANGVIVITTKKGQKGRMSVGYSGNFSVSARMNYNKLELMNSKERVAVSREAYEKGCIFQEESPIGYGALAVAYKRREISYEEFCARVKDLETNNTDWFDILFRVPFTHSHTINVSGGSDKTTYRASFGASQNNNTAKGNDQRSYNGNLNINTTFWDKVTLNFGLSGSWSKTNGFVGTDPFSYANSTNRAIACYNKDGSLYYYPTGYNNYLYNIVNELENSGNQNTKSSLNSNFSLRWTIGKGFTFSTLLGYNTSTSFGESWFTELSNYIAGKRGYNFGEYGPEDDPFKNSHLPYGGELNVSESRNTNYTWRNQLEFARTFGVHAINAMFGQEARSTKYDGYSQTNYGYLPDRGKTFAQVPVVVGSKLNEINPLVRTNPTIIDRTSNYLSYYGNVSYMYDDRYAVNASVRMDASNRFGQDKSARFQPVWSTGVRWNITKEHWLEGQEILNDISLRASFGYQGNVAENVSPELVCKMKTVDPNTGEYALTISHLPTPKLRWEKNKSINLGFDFSILHSKINGSFEYYFKKTEDMVVSRKIPFENGVVTMPVNGGNMSNSGWDLSFSLVPVRTKDFVWTLGMNTSKVYNKVESDLEPTGKWSEAVSGSLDKEGYAVSSFWAWRFKGINQENGAPIIDMTNTGNETAKTDATEYLVYAGKKDPDFTAGLNTSFRYKSLSLSANFYLSTGNQKFLANPYANGSRLPSEYYNMSSELVKRWQKPGDQTDIPGLPHPLNCATSYPFADPHAPFNVYEAWANSDIRVVDAWYLRCNNLTLSYVVPEKYISSFAQSISCSFNMSNPFQIVSKDFHSRDPEVASGGQPLSRNYTFSINVSF